MCVSLYVCVCVCPCVLQEAMLCVKELESPGSLHMFVYFALNHILERSQQARRQCGQLMATLLWQNLISLNHYTKGYVVLDTGSNLKCFSRTHKCLVVFVESKNKWWVNTPKEGMM